MKELIAVEAALFSAGRPLDPTEKEEQERKKEESQGAHEGYNRKNPRREGNVFPPEEGQGVPPIFRHKKILSPFHQLIHAGSERAVAHKGISGTCP